jgi:hypothetical protein
MSSEFHAVEFMRRRRAEIDAEDEGLTWEQRSEKTLRLLEKNPRWQRLKRRVVRSTRTPEPVQAILP